MRSTALALLMCASALLGGCVSRAQTSDFCAVSSPVILDSLDGKTDAELRAIVTHNALGEKLCGWKPPAP